MDESILPSIENFLFMVRVATMLFEMLFSRLETLETVFISTSTMVFQHQIAIMTGVRNTIVQSISTVVGGSAIVVTQILMESIIEREHTKECKMEYSGAQPEGDSIHFEQLK